MASQKTFKLNVLNVSTEQVIRTYFTKANTQCFLEKVEDKGHGKGQDVVDSEVLQPRPNPPKKAALMTALGNDSNNRHDLTSTTKFRLAAAAAATQKKVEQLEQKVSTKMMMKVEPMDVDEDDDAVVPQQQRNETVQARAQKFVQPLVAPPQPRHSVVENIQQNVASASASASVYDVNVPRSSKILRNAVQLNVAANVNVPRSSKVLRSSTQLNVAANYESQQEPSSAVAAAAGANAFVQTGTGGSGDWAHWADSTKVQEKTAGIVEKEMKPHGILQYDKELLVKIGIQVGRETLAQLGERLEFIQAKLAEFEEVNRKVEQELTYYQNLKSTLENEIKEVMDFLFEIGYHLSAELIAARVRMP